MGREAWSGHALIATVALLAAAAPAHAATVSVNERAVAYTAAPGERNSMGLYIASGGVHVADRVPIAPGPGCVTIPSAASGRYEAICALTFGEPSVKIRTLDGDDAVIVKPVAFPPGAGVTGMTIDGGRGQDSLSVFQDIQGPISLRGGPGADYIHAAGPQLRVSGDSGDDVIFARTTLLAGVVIEAARLYGRSGNDTIAVRPAGPIGARPSSTERLDGGSGKDLLFGNDGTDVIRGGAGADRIGGFTRVEMRKQLRRSKNRRARASSVFGARSRYLEVGTDVLVGGDGNDRIRGDYGNDVVSGGRGMDALAGGPDADLLAGGSGRDTLSGGGGGDLIFAGAGADTLRGDAGSDNLVTADDNQRDLSADCGRGRGDRLVGGIADISAALSRQRRFHITRLGKAGGLPPDGYPVPASAIATVSFPSVGTRVEGCERLAIAP